VRASSQPRKGAPALVAGALALAAAAALTGQAAAASHRVAGTTGAAASAPVVVTLGEMFYKPAVVRVKAGQKVVFRNVGKIAHTVADTDAKGEIRSQLIKPRNLDPGQSQTVSFAKAGKVAYLCTFHPTLMRGTIVVTR
jgi:plastocyanin